MDVDRGDGRALVVVVEDDPSQQSLFRRWLENDGYAVEVFDDAESCLAHLDRLVPSLLCLDLGLPGLNGLGLLEELRRRSTLAEILVLTAENGVDSVVAAMRLGSYNYLVKPVDRSRLLVEASLAVDRAEAALALRRLEREADGRGYGGMIGQAPLMQALYRQMDRVAPTEVAVLIHGESGTGKELVARALQAGSTRSQGPFVALSCAAIPESLQEAELFGHERGAFTGALASRPGRLEEAHQGTLFLDEIGELSGALQAKLLRVLQERTFRRIGGSREIHSSFRLLTATHRDLAAEVEAGRFREDLFFRIAVFELEVPPLRERREDIPLLAGHFLAQAAQDRESSSPPPRLAPQTVALLLQHTWPGNVRELRNAIEHACVLARGPLVLPEHLPARLLREARAQHPGDAAARRAEPAAGSVLSLEESERLSIAEALRRSAGNLSGAARQLGIGRTTLYRKIKKYSLDEASR